MERLVIKDEYSKLIPALSEDEYKLLEQSIISDGCRDTLVIWGSQNCILDGHNRYAICTEHNIEFKTIKLEFLDSNGAEIWVINNQLGRRNISDFTKVELQILKKDLLLQQGKRNDLLLSFNDKSYKKHNTRKQLAEEIGISTGKFAQAEVVLKKATNEVKEKVKAGDITIGKAYNDIIRNDKREKIIEKLESVESKKVKEIEGVYDVVVIDPPWQMQKIERDCAPTQTEFDYPTMSLEEITDLKIPCADDCHVWLWTTQKYLPSAFELLNKWDLKYVCTFVWHKNGGFQVYGLPQYNCEFILYARKGVPLFLDTKDFNTCFSAKRGKHSEKPDEFYDMVKRVTGGRRLDMFNRRLIDGFDTWGNEAYGNN